ncbi:regulatory protein, luxR family [Sphingopyxis sp. YR583]|uniref:LuxR family transcriptional regulator n=1 Tax=Sphingopyxis sp. YR583 TaxID=1881047 RepID=UPI0008A74287|nr:LuxR family transcriptional regulator [Sphingopyxis sp. YR583]SEH12847.1 regulatory protein, luxR family [Sphingopyxis sp. YR583]
MPCRDRLEALEFADDFIVAVRAATCLGEIEDLLEGAARFMDFRHYAMIHHDDARSRSPGLIHMQNYPAVYAERYIAEQLYRNDPVVLACLAADACFAWDQIGELITVDRRHRRFIEAGAREGVSDGVTVPSFVLGERSGSCHFSGPRDPDRARCFVGPAHLVGSYAFQAARRIMLGGRLREFRVARLTPRQRDCIVLIGRGLSNKMIARKLGISDFTVKTYIQRASELYEAHTRTQLVISAVLDGEVGVHEVLPSKYLHLVD